MSASKSKSSTKSTSQRLFAAALALGLVTASAARADFIDLWANKTDVPQNKAPPRGHSKLLVIPVQIDYAGTSGTYVPLDLTTLNDFFSGAASQGTFNFAGYLKIASSARFTADVTVAPLVEYTGCPPTLTAVQDMPSDCTIIQGDIASLTSDLGFVKDVMQKAHAAGVDFSKFDVNGVYSTADGTIDGVMIVVNVPGIHLTLPITYVNSGPIVMDGVNIPYVSIGGAVTFADTSVHYETMITEEFGKQLGLANLANEHTSGTDLYQDWQGLHFSTMGDWNYGSANVLPDPESRRALVWQDQVVVSGTQTLTLQPAAAGGYAVKLGMMSATRQEYFLAEARGPIGAYDTQIVDASGNPTWGLAVYHVDWSKGPQAQMGQFVNQLVSCLDCTPWHPFISNVESNGLFDLIFDGPASIKAGGVTDDHVLFENNSVTLESIPAAGVLSASNRYLGTNWYDGTESEIRISNVMVNADHTVTATFTAPTFSNPCADVSCPPLMVCQTTGMTAGSCVDMTIPVADGGPTNPNDAGTNTTPPGSTDSGCATSGSETTSAALWLLPLALLLAAALRRRARV